MWFPASGHIVQSLLLLLAAASAQPPKCNNVSFRNFGLQAAYSASDADTSAKPVLLKGCEAVNAFHMVRHGTRWASEGDNQLILSLRKLQESIKSNVKAKRAIDLCAADLDSILTWTTHVDQVKAYALMEQGRQDQKLLGRRFGLRLPFLAHASASEITIKHGATSRTQESGENFALGLFGRAEKTDGYDLQSDFFAYCPKFDVDYLLYKVSGPFSTYESSSEMKEVINSISGRLGFEKPLQFSDIEAMFTSCGFETAWNVSKPNVKPAWCKVFQPHDFAVLEYWSDLRENQRTGYFKEDFHKKLGCKPISEMYSYFKDVVKADGKFDEKARFFFTHDTLINQIITFLGLYKDNQGLSAKSANMDRKYRVTRFSPFASNIGGVLFRCAAAAGSAKYRVQMFLNEAPLQLPGCDGSICSWEQFTAKFGNLHNTCHVTGACLGLA